MEAGATARISRYPSPIAIELTQVTEKSNGLVKVPVNSLKQRTEVLRLMEVRQSEGQRRERWSEGLRKTITRKQSVSSGSPSVGELTGLAVMSQWSTEDSCASGLEATSVRVVESVSCQNETFPIASNLCIDTAELKTTHLLPPGVKEVGLANNARVQIKPVCQGVTGAVSLFTFPS